VRSLQEDLESSAMKAEGDRLWFETHLQRANASLTQLDRAYLESRQSLLNKSRRAKALRFKLKAFRLKAKANVFRIKNDLSVCYRDSNCTTNQLARVQHSLSSTETDLVRCQATNDDLQQELSLAKSQLETCEKMSNDLLLWTLCDYFRISLEFVGLLLLVERALLRLLLWRPRFRSLRDELVKMKDAICYLGFVSIASCLCVLNSFRFFFRVLFVFIIEASKCYDQAFRICGLSSLHKESEGFEHLMSSDSISFQEESLGFSEILGHGCRGALDYHEDFFTSLDRWSGSSGPSENQDNSLVEMILMDFAQLDDREIQSDSQRASPELQSVDESSSVELKQSEIEIGVITAPAGDVISNLRNQDSQLWKWVNAKLAETAELLKEKDVENQGLRRQSASTEREFDELKKVLTKTQLELDETCSELSRLSAENSLLCNENADLMKGNKLRDSEIARLKGVVSELKTLDMSQKDENKLLDQKCSEKIQELSRTRSELTDAKKDLEDVMSELAAQKEQARNDELEKKYEALWKSYCTLSEEQEKLKQECSGNLQQFQATIQSLSLQIQAADDNIGDLLVEIAQLKGQDPGAPFGAPGRIEIPPGRYEQYKQGLQRQGLRLVSTRGDGNCLFHAFSMLMNIPQDKVLELRRFTMQFFKENAHVILEPDVLQSFKLPEYVSIHKSDGTWSDPMICIALAHAFGVQVHLYNLAILGEPRFEIYGDSSVERVVKIFFNGNTHYEAILPL